MDVPDRRAVLGRPVRRELAAAEIAHPRRDLTTAEERTALQNALDDERATRDVRSNVPVRATALLRDPQIMLFCFLYFSIQLTIYAATFWLPTIIRKMGGSPISRSACTTRFRG